MGCTKINYKENLAQDMVCVKAWRTIYSGMIKVSIGLYVEYFWQKVKMSLRLYIAVTFGIAKNTYCLNRQNKKHILQDRIEYKDNGVPYLLHR